MPKSRPGSDLAIFPRPTTLTIFSLAAPPHVHRQRERKRVVLLGPLDAAEAAADTLAAWKRAGAVSPSPLSPEIACAAATRAMIAADRGLLLWDSPQYQEPLPAVPVPAAKRSAPAAFADPGFQPEAPMSIKRRRFQPAPSSSGALAQKTLPSSDRVLGADEGPSCYVLLTTPSKMAAAPAASSKSAAAPATSSKNDAAPSAGSRGWFVLSNGEIFESGAKAEKIMLSENVNAKFVPDLESARAWLISIAK
ncbi:hypothetical protein DFH06DRAFT_1320712 [Mycena polygramma]|nr:hypothetical protein DFH06DRAFT_1320712 [Mycena polygramma]